MLAGWHNDKTCRGQEGTDYQFIVCVSFDLFHTLCNDEGASLSFTAHVQSVEVSRNQAFQDAQRKNINGELISIRQDLSRTYRGGGNGKGDQGHHFNSEHSGEIDSFSLIRCLFQFNKLLVS